MTKMPNSTAMSESYLQSNKAQQREFAVSLHSVYYYTTELT